MVLSVVIVNWNTRDYLLRCLESIRADSSAGAAEVIVVDNGSSDGSAQMVRERFGEVSLIENAENLGYAEANNQGISASRGEYILLLNPDTELKPGVLGALVSFAKGHPDAAAVGCRLAAPDGKVQRSCRSFPGPLGVLFEYAGLSRLFPRRRLFGSYRMTYFDYSRDAEVDQPMGSCLLISRKAWDGVGKFDKDFPIFFNEVDWCYRAKQMGWKVYFTAGAEVVHYGGASTRQVRPQMVRESHRALRKFYQKHYRSRLPLPVYWFILMAIRVNSFLASRLTFADR
ncbi:MAG TPA: glycosyltransferase family 2 protein [Armatimonadota bacterium]|nr:glycosyltransferase family 2 protein [Armatimonadota bacterium]